MELTNPYNVSLELKLSSIHYHNFNILLHRPFMSGQDSPAMPEIKTEMTRRNHAECTRSAETLTLVVKEIEKYYSLVRGCPYLLLQLASKR